MGCFARIILIIFLLWLTVPEKQKDKQMDEFYWLGERIKTYKILMEEQAWQEAGFQEQFDLAEETYEEAIIIGTDLIRQVIAHYEALKARKD